MAPLRTIESEADIREGVAALTAQDPLMEAVFQVAGEPPLRRRPGGFEGLTRIIVGQQLSVHAADAIWQRLERRVRPLDQAKVSRTRDATLRTCGLSAAKVRTLRAIAAALREGHLDFDAVHSAGAKEAMEMLCAVKGVGPWTAEIYLLFCHGHPDIWPGGDLALQAALQHALDLDERPSAKETIAMAERWAPWRGVAARLLWAYYRETRSPKSGVPV